MRAQAAASSPSLGEGARTAGVRSGRRTGILILPHDLARVLNPS
jgi:hypothetical protein